MKQEQAIELRMLRELLALHVPKEMLDRQVKCSAGIIDIVIYTQPRCLIEVKAILDEPELKRPPTSLVGIGPVFQGHGYLLPGGSYEWTAG